MVRCAWLFLRVAQQSLLYREGLQKDGSVVSTVEIGCSASLASSTPPGITALGVVTANAERTTHESDRSAIRPSASSLWLSTATPISSWWVAENSLLSFDRSFYCSTRSDLFVGNSHGTLTLLCLSAQGSEHQYHSERMHETDFLRQYTGVIPRESGSSLGPTRCTVLSCYESRSRRSRP